MRSIVFCGSSAASLNRNMSIAKECQLSCRFRTRRGQSRANQIFEFIKWFEPAKEKCKLMVTSVVGHIYGLTFEDGRTRDNSTLFNSKVKKVIEDSTKKLRIVEHLQELGQEADYLALWLDCDREGENIGFEVISLVSQWIPYDNVYRYSTPPPQCDHVEHFLVTLLV